MQYLSDTHKNSQKFLSDLKSFKPYFWRGFNADGEVQFH